jgi:hypothetical protein
MGAPVTALSSVPVMLAGSITMGAGAAGATGCGALSLLLATGAGASRFSSLELQLEIPKAANSESTRIVKAIRAGVHNGFVNSVRVTFFISCLLMNPDYRMTITENGKLGTDALIS